MRFLKKYAFNTHQGPYLQINEDNVEVDLVNNLFFVLDGYGGSGIGDKVVENLKQDIKTFFTKIGDDPDATMPFYYNPQYLLEGNALINAVHLGHHRVLKYNEEREMGQRGGASIIGVALSDSIATIVSCGNCSAYLYRKGHLVEIMPADDFRFLTKDAFNKDDYYIPSSSLGMFESLNLVIKEVRLLPEDRLILSTDGANSMVELTEFKYILEKNNLNGTEKISELFELNNSRGNHDNQSVLLLEF